MLIRKSCLARAGQSCDFPNDSEVTMKDTVIWNRPEINLTKIKMRVYLTQYRYSMMATVFFPISSKCVRWFWWGFISDCQARVSVSTIYDGGFFYWSSASSQSQIDFTAKYQTLFATYFMTFSHPSLKELCLRGSMTELEMSCQCMPIYRQR